jgi:O-antigen ligase
MQFSNSVLGIAAVPLAVRSYIDRPSRPALFVAVLLTTAVAVSLTRMSMFAVAAGGVATVVVAIVWPSLAGRWLGPSRRTVVARGAGVGAALGLAIALGLGAVMIGVATGNIGSGRPSVPASEIGRVVFNDTSSDLGAIGRGRLATFRTALDQILRSPVAGTGLGTLVPIPYTFGGAKPATPGLQPGVDNAILTVGLKAGVIGMLALAGLLLLPLWLAVRRRTNRHIGWFVPAWLAVLGLTITQAFATSGYGPFGLGLLVVLLALPNGGRAAPSRRRWLPGVGRASGERRVSAG